MRWPLGTLEKWTELGVDRFHVLIEGTGRAVSLVTEVKP